MSLNMRKVPLFLFAKFRPSVKNVQEVSVQHYRALPWDIDEFLHMNNSRYLNYMELGRWDIMLRAGFIKVALKQGWIAPIGSLRIQYLRGLKMLEKFSVHSRVTSWDEKWIYFEHVFFAQEQCVALGHVKVTVVSKGGSIPPKEVFRELGVDFQDSPPLPSAALWKECDRTFFAETKKL